MRNVTIIGAEGFLGSAFVTYLSGIDGIELIKVTRRNYAEVAATPSDIVIEAACNSKKYLADERPVEEFDLSVTHRLRTLKDFPAALHVHISSVDVYDDLASPERTREDSAIDLIKLSHYGFHKLLAENLVRHYADSWLILRPAGMVGPGLRKNPVYDILHDQPLRIHPDSQYQFLRTEDVARIAWELIEQEISGEIFNICGEGLISPLEIAELAGRKVNFSLLDPTAQPRIVNINIDKIKQIAAAPRTREVITQFIHTQVAQQRFEGVSSWAR